MGTQARGPRILLLAIGNPYRGDDGVGQRVAERVRAVLMESVDSLLTGTVHLECRHHLTPELAEHIASHECVIILDADPAATLPFLEEIYANGQTVFTMGPNSHHLSPEILAHLARALYRWRGRVLLLHLPSRDFSPGLQLSPLAENGVESALALLASFSEGNEGLCSHLCGAQIIPV